MMRLVSASRYALLAALLVLVPGAGGASPPPTLNGTWKLEAKTSDPLSPILKNLGYGWFARQVMESLSVEQVITTTSKGVAVRVITRFTNDTIVLPYDNQWVEARTLDGGTTERRSRWLKKQPALLTEDRFPQGLLTTTRLRVDPSTFHEVLTFSAPGKPILRAVRVFRRQ